MAILPGATIGILGGGQAPACHDRHGRPVRSATGVRILDPDPRCAASAVADEVVVGAFDDPAAACALARGSAVVTYEIEKIDRASLEAAQSVAPVRPSPAVLALVQDRLLQKEWLVQHGFPVGPFARVDRVEDALFALSRYGTARLKARRGGYDGRSQVKVPAGSTKEEVQAAHQALGSGACLCEQELPVVRELSVLVARRLEAGRAEVQVFPAAENWHEDAILAFSVLPGALDPELARKAEAMGRSIAEVLGVEGLSCAIEFFRRPAGGELLVNELAPRPHNTFPATETACLTSQFEQLVRAVCGLPLGSTDVLRPTALANLLGDLWLRGRRSGRPPHLDRALALPGDLSGRCTARSRAEGGRSAICWQWVTHPPRRWRWFAKPARGCSEFGRRLATPRLF